MPGTRATVYLAGPAAEALERLKTVYRNKYGIATTVSSVFARLLLGETFDEVIERPYRQDLARIGSEIDTLRDELRGAQARRRMNVVRRIHRDAADLYPAIKQIAVTLGRAKRRNESSSPDLAEAGRIEGRLDELMTACADAIVPSRRR